MLVPVVDMKLTGQNIASLRVKRGISVREMQHMLGFTTPQSIYKWQRGETLPTLENLAALACILNVAMDDILAVECRRAGS
jgi:transcriptional regulator with XRE-family HTH domain